MRLLMQILFGVLALSLTACGKKSSRGNSQRPPPPIAQPPIQEDFGPEVPGGVDGPERLDSEGRPRRPSAKRPTPSWPRERDRDRHADRDDDEDFEEEDNSESDRPRRSTPSGSERRPERQREQVREALPWYPPNLDGTPARFWLENNVEPNLAILEESGPLSKFHNRPFMITFALGYFDGYQTKALEYDEVHYGRHAALDPFLRSVLHEVLERPCYGRMEICGFQMVRVDEVQTLFRREGPGGVEQQIRVLSGAETPQYVLNVGEMKSRQRHRSEKATRLFAESFMHSDMVVYVGHSRDGGGPDFNPPKLARDKVDYPFYRSQKPGLKRLVSALKMKPRKAQSVAILSCDSTKFFLAPMRQAAPGISALTITGQVYSEDLLAEGIVAVDYFLRNGSLNGLRHH